LDGRDVQASISLDAGSQLRPSYAMNITELIDEHLHPRQLGRVVSHDHVMVHASLDVIAAQAKDPDLMIEDLGSLSGSKQVVVTACTRNLLVIGAHVRPPSSGMPPLGPTLDPRPQTLCVRCQPLRARRPRLHGQEVAERAAGDSDHDERDRDLALHLVAEHRRERLLDERYLAVRALFVAVRICGYVGLQGPGRVVG
jgi:hypothetical protein